jgi:hypothetical protein
MILLLITAILFVIYNIFVLIKFGVPESLSATSYLFKEKYNQHWWFSLICVVIIIGLIPIWIELSSINTQFLAFLSCGGILFIAASPFFKNGMDKKVHYTAGIITTITFILWFIFNGYYLWLIYIGITCIPFITWKPKSFIYFIEIIAYIYSILFILM